MPQLDGDAVILEPFEQPFEIAARVRLVLEAGGKLREQRAELVRRCERLDRAAELVHVLVSEVPRILSGCLVEHFRVRELLKQLERELEAGRRAPRPPLRRLDRWHAVERRVNLDGVEMLGVEREPVDLQPSARARLGGIEDAVPRALAGGIAPAGRADANVSG